MSDTLSWNTCCYLTLNHQMHSVCYTLMCIAKEFLSGRLLPKKVWENIRVKRVLEYRISRDKQRYLLPLPFHMRKNNTGVINDPLGQFHIHINNYFYWKEYMFYSSIFFQNLEHTDRQTWVQIIITMTEGWPSGSKNELNPKFRGKQIFCTLTNWQQLNKFSYKENN